MEKKNLLVTGGVLAVGALALGTGFAVGNGLTANASEDLQPEPIVETFESSYGEASDWGHLLDGDFFFRDLDIVASELETETGITPILEETEHGQNWILEEEDGITGFIVEEVHFDQDGNVIE